MPPQKRHDPFEIIEAEFDLRLGLNRHRILRAKQDVIRTYVVDPTIIEIVQFTPREFAFVGVGVGTTRLVFWFRGGQRPVVYSVHVNPEWSGFGRGRF